MRQRKPQADGGSAFPIKPYSHANRWQPGSDGMSLRDYLAGQALAGMLASAPIANRTGPNINKPRWAVVAYEFADAMLLERAK